MILISPFLSVPCTQFWWNFFKSRKSLCTWRKQHWLSVSPGLKLYITTHLFTPSPLHTFPGISCVWGNMPNSRDDYWEVFVLNSLLSCLQVLSQTLGAKWIPDPELGISGLGCIEFLMYWACTPQFHQCIQGQQQVCSHLWPTAWSSLYFGRLNYLWRRQWHPTPVLLPGKSHGWRSLVGCSPWGR